VSLSWTAPSNNGGAVIDYYLIYVDGIVRSNHYLNISTTITGLTNDQNYSFAILAHNSVGAGVQSLVITAIPTTVVKAPGVPLELTATPGDARVTLSWTSPNNDGGAAIDYYVVYQDGLDVSHPTMTTKTVTGLTNEQSYNFTVAAHNSIGIGSLTSTVTATPNSTVAAPGIPTDLVTIAGVEKVTMSWTAPSDSSAIDYYVVYQNGIDVLHISATSATITGLTNGENYSFAVAAHNSVGVGVQSTVHNISPIEAINKDAALPSGNDAMAYFALGLALLVSAIIAAFLVVRRNRKKENDRR
jgi:chitodextrinase